VAAVRCHGPADARLVVIHLRDYHYCPPDLCEAAGIGSEQHLADVERVQADQLPIAWFLAERIGVRAVYKEGLTSASLPD
jgi:hypothetical protein